MNTTNLILRWSIGFQDTVKLDSFEQSKYDKIIWMTKLSIASFQKWFKNADYYLLYNGDDFTRFVDHFNVIEPLINIKIINQKTNYINQYNFTPRGVWWKWIPFRIDKNKTEIAIDTDIICINEPTTWYEWINDEYSQFLITPERYDTVKENTCGDLSNHPILKNKHPLNCGVVGQKSEFDFSDTFFEIANGVNIGSTINSLFITEQGVLNVLARSIELNNMNISILDFKKNAWFRDFIYFLKNGVNVETIHATTWHKYILFDLKNIIEQKIFNNSYSNQEFMVDILKTSDTIQPIQKLVIKKQILESGFSNELLVSF